MDRRGLLETGGVALASGVVTAGILEASVGWIQWSLVLGVVAAAAIAAAANYRGRTGHAENVATEAPPSRAEASDHGEAATEYVVSATPSDATTTGHADGTAPARDAGEGSNRPEAGDSSAAATPPDAADVGDDPRADGGEGTVAERALYRAPDA